MNLADIEQLNDCADFLYGAGVTATPISFPEASKLFIETQELSQVSERLRLGLAWTEFCRVNKVLYYQIAGTICAPEHVVKGMEAELRASYSRVKASANGVAKEARDTLDKLVSPNSGAWAKLAKMDCSPFYAVIKEKITEAIERKQRNLVLILRHNRFREETLRLLGDFQSSINVEVKKANELRNHPRVDRVFCLGSMRSLRRLDEEFLIRAPITDEFEFLELSHDGKLQNAGLDVFPLAPGQRFPLNQAPVAGKIEDIKPKLSTQVPDEEFENDANNELSDHALESDALRVVEAYRAILGGGYKTTLSSESKVFIPRCRNHGKRLICNSLEQKEVIELEPGDLIILTTEDSGDLIAPHADKLIGAKAQTYRDLQSAWKRDLAALVKERGTARVIEQIKSASGFEVSATNLRQWLGDTVHGPGDERARLFPGILKLLGRSEKKSIHHEALDQIREASRRAGIQLQADLRRMLVGVDMSLVLSHGYIKFRMDDNGPEKTIFEIQKIDTSVRSVNPHYINRVFKLKHGADNT